jgi:hypothetical protein
MTTMNEELDQDLVSFADELLRNGFVQAADACVEFDSLRSLKNAYRNSADFRCSHPAIGRLIRAGHRFAR